MWLLLLLLLLFLLWPIVFLVTRFVQQHRDVFRFSYILRSVSVFWYLSSVSVPAVRGAGSLCISAQEERTYRRYPFPPPLAPFPSPARLFTVLACVIGVPSISFQRMSSRRVIPAYGINEVEIDNTKYRGICPERKEGGDSWPNAFGCRGRASVDARRCEPIKFTRFVILWKREGSFFFSRADSGHGKI